MLTLLAAHAWGPLGGRAFGITVFLMVSANRRMSYNADKITRSESIISGSSQFNRYRDLIGDFRIQIYIQTGSFEREDEAVFDSRIGSP